MKRLLIMSIIFLLPVLLFTFLPTPALANTVVNFPDPNLEAAIRATINKPTGDILDTDLVPLYQLTANNKSISSLSGLEYCINLQDLRLGQNQIADISALASLTKLQLLELHNNQIANISVLANLTSLQSLLLYQNQIDNISALANLTNLRDLRLNQNQMISDILALANLTNLQTLRLNYNRIADISALANLTNLQTLDVAQNRIADISVLAKLTKLRDLYLYTNEIADISALANLTNLQNLDLAQNRIADILALANLTNLQTLRLNANQIGDISVLANLTNLQTLELNANRIADISVLANLTKLRDLSLYTNEIANISALANLTNLQYLDLAQNRIADIPALANLINLQTLWLSGNQIADISVLANLTNLQHLYLGQNQIADIPALANLTNLQILYLDRNQITDIPALANLTNLQSLRLGYNQIADISALANLNNLLVLELYSNQISDITVLVTNQGLASGDTVRLAVNYLDVTAGSQDMADIQTLINRGVNVTYLGQRQFSLSVNHSGQGTVDKNPNQAAYYYGTSVQLMVTPNAGWSFASWSGDVSGSTSPVTIVMNGNRSVTATFTQNQYTLGITTVGSGSVSKNPNLATYVYGTSVQLKATPATGWSFAEWSGDVSGSTNTVSITMNGNNSVTATFTQTAVIFPDPNLKAAIRQAINKPSGDIYPSDLLPLTYLYAPYNSISNLSGLEYCINLQMLYLHNNNITNISPLASLTNLTRLMLDWNQIASISALATLTNLQMLSIFENQISNISALASLTNLQTLDIRYNRIADISALAKLTNLKILWLGPNPISNISALANLINLQNLSLYYCQIADISALASLTNLQELGLQSNQIADISALVTNQGLVGSGDTIVLQFNYLDVTAGSQDMADIQTLINRGVNVIYLPQEQFSLTVNMSGQGTVAKNPNQGGYYYGMSVELTATPAAGWSFAGWSGDLSGSTNPVTITMNGNKSATANFTGNTPAGNNVVVQPVDTTTGTPPVTLTFTTVTQSGATTLTTSSSGPAAPAGLRLAGSYYEITTTAVFSGNVMVCITYDPAAVTDPASLKLEHYVGGDWVEVIPTSLNATNHTICGSVTSLSPFGIFVINTYTVNASVSGSGGTVSPATQTVNYGGGATITITPDAGYDVADVSVDGSSVGAVSSYTFSNVTANHTIVASFTISNYTLTVNTMGSGTVNRNNPGPYHYGDVVQLTAVPAAGWEFAIWSGDLSGNTNPVTITMNGNKSVTANFVGLPSILVSPVTCSFGNVKVGTSSTRTVTITNTGYGNLSMTLGTLNSPYSYTVSGDLSQIEPNETRWITITYKPTSAVYSTASLSISSNDPANPLVGVQLSGTGLPAEIPPSQQIRDILKFFDASVANGSLVGSGNGNSAQGRLGALRNMIKAAGDFINQGRIAAARQQVQDAYLRVDGRPQPPDFAAGTAAAKLASMILQLKNSL